MNFCEEVARKKLNKGSDWLMTGWECVGDTRDLIVRGAVPVGTYKSGPRKGRNKFSPPFDSCVVTHAEEVAQAEAWEAETGKCSNCEGRGQEWAGWSADSGNRYRDCRRCGATGNKP